jgi:cell wall-associated NlpC family hydrolase
MMSISVKIEAFLPVGLILLHTLCACDEKTRVINLKAEIDSISKSFVPDGREGICIAELVSNESGYVLRGETDKPEAKRAIAEFIESKKIAFRDSLMLLPDTSAIKEPWGLVTLSVCNIRSEPSQDAEMVSQAIMGTPVKILKERRGWYLVQTPDLYLGWTEGESIESLSEQELDGWKESSRLVFLEKTGDILADPAGEGIVSDIVAGSIVGINGVERGFFKVSLPDGRTGYLEQKGSAEFKRWSSEVRPEGDRILRSAFRFTGSPYLWGGTSSKGVDCSGFVKTVYQLNGMILARDVSLQFRHVMHMTKAAFPDSLKKGDLLFFGSVRNGKPRPTHVGIYIGDTEFIHSSGMVRVNSLDSTRSNFSRYRRNTFLGAGRITGLEPGPGLQMLADHPWYNKQ